MAGDIKAASLHSVQGMQLRLARNDPFDMRSFCDLFNSLYTRKVDHRYYSWQFFSTPFPTCLAVATTADGRWIGCFGCHVIPGASGVPSVGWMIDLMIKPEFRGRGIFRQLAAFLLTAIDQYKPSGLGALSNENADRIFTDSLGWKRVSTIHTFTRSTEDVPAPSGNSEFRTFSRIDPGILASIAMNFRVPLISQSRSEAVLRWRFLDNPWYHYEMLVASQNHNDLAALVMKTFRDPESGGSFGDVVDVIWARKDPILLRDLLIAALHHCNRAGIRTASTWLQTNTVLDRAGEELGFTSSKQLRYYNCRILDARFARLASPSGCYLTMAAADLF